MKSPMTLNPPFHVNMNTAGQGSSPLLSPVLSDVGGARVEEEDEAKRKVRQEMRDLAGEEVDFCSCLSCHSLLLVLLLNTVQAGILMAKNVNANSFVLSSSAMLETNDLQRILFSEIDSNLQRCFLMWCAVCVGSLQLTNLLGS